MLKLTLVLFVCVAVADASWFGSYGSPQVSTPAGVQSDDDAFDKSFGLTLLDRIFRGKAVKVAVEKSRKIGFEQEASCSTCGENGPHPQHPETTTSASPSPTLVNYGSSYIEYQCFGYNLPLNLQAYYPSAGYSYASAVIISSSNGDYTSYVYVAGTSQSLQLLVNGGYQPSTDFTQTLQVTVTDSNERISNPVYITVHYPSCYSTATTSTSTASTTPYLTINAYGSTDLYVYCSYSGNVVTSNLLYTNAPAYQVSYHYNGVGSSSNGDYNQYVTVDSAGNILEGPNIASGYFDQIVYAYATNNYYGQQSGSIALMIHYRCGTTTWSTTGVATDATTAAGTYAPTTVAATTSWTTTQTITTSV